MVDMMNTDFKPGDIVRHPKHGPGIVYVSPTYPDQLHIMYRNVNGLSASTANLTDWERVETCTELERRWLDYRGGVHCTCDTYPETTNGPEEDCEIHGRPYEDWVKRGAELQDELARAEIVKPGHVQVRVDDLDLSHWLNKQEGDNIWGEASRVAIRAAKAVAAQRAESTPTADEKPMSATVTLFCPDCGEAENVTVVMLGRQSNGQRWFDLREFHAHTCPPAQPDEPTEFGARVTVTLPEGTPEKWLRVVSGDDWPWRNSDGDRHFWAYLIERGAVTLGWDE